MCASYPNPPGAHVHMGCQRQYTLRNPHPPSSTMIFFSTDMLKKLSHIHHSGRGDLVVGGRELGLKRKLKCGTSRATVRGGCQVGPRNPRLEDSATLNVANFRPEPVGGGGDTY